jgi:hypothetical protein
MLVDTVHTRNGQSLRDFCARLVEAGRESISLASRYLRNR